VNLSKCIKTNLMTCRSCRYRSAQQLARKHPFLTCVIEYVSANCLEFMFLIVNWISKQNIR